MAISFKGAHCPQDLMRMGVRWSLTSPLRSRHGEARMTECGVRLDHATTQRWVVKDSPLLEEAWHRRTRPMLGFKAFEATQATLTGLERMHRLKKKPHSTELRGRAPTPFVIPLQLCSLTPILGHPLHRPSDLRMTHAKHYPPDPRKPDYHC